MIRRIACDFLRKEKNVFDWGLLFRWTDARVVSWISIGILGIYATIATSILTRAYFPRTFFLSNRFDMCVQDFHVWQPYFIITVTKMT